LPVLTVFITDDQMEDLRRRKEATGVPVSEIVRRALWNKEELLGQALAPKATPRPKPDAPARQAAPEEEDIFQPYVSRATPTPVRSYSKADQVGKRK
jgi:hypothetical protein